jgi:hypothetical protein
MKTIGAIRTTSLARRISATTSQVGKQRRADRRETAKDKQRSAQLQSKLLKAIDVNPKSLPYQSLLKALAKRLRVFEGSDNINMGLYKVLDLPGGNILALEARRDKWPDDPSYQFGIGDPTNTTAWGDPYMDQDAMPKGVTVQDVIDGYVALAERVAKSKTTRPDFEVSNPDYKTPDQLRLQREANRHFR